MIITIPLRGPEIETLFNEYDRFISEVVTFGNIAGLIPLLAIVPSHSKISKISFSIIESSSDDDKIDSHIAKIVNNNPGFVMSYLDEFLQIELEFTHEYDEWAIPIFVNNLILKFSLIIHLSFATKIDFMQGVIYKGEDFVSNTELVASNIDFAYEHSFKMNWPKLNPVSFDKTISSFIKNEMLLEGSSKNKLHRAINAFSYMFSNLQEQDTSHLFWHMLGIEALLASNSNGVLNQIRTKTSIILGEPKDFKKKLGKLYDYRSRFVHGDIDFPPKFSADFELFEREYWDYLSFSTSILLALIRELIEKEVNEFKFEYKLIN